MNTWTSEIETKGQLAKVASRKLAFLSTAIKNKALNEIADALITNESTILSANSIDYQDAKTSGMSAAMLDRLMLSSDRLKAIALDVRMVASLPDPVGETIEEQTLPNGLLLNKKRVPLGVIAAIYESRPNVTVDISVLCVKAGNAVILRGGKETLHSNFALATVIQKAAYQAGVPEGAIQFIESADRELVDRMLKMKGIIDLIIPRGGANLIKFVSENSAVAVVTGGIGVCHTYVDKSADIKKAIAIVYNAKVQRPTVCNALDTILVHKDIAGSYLPQIAKELSQAGVEMHCDERAFTLLSVTLSSKIQMATQDDWGKEFLSLTAAIKIVDSIDDAIQHIEHYGSGHSEAIIAEDKTAYMRFLNEVDAACVYANASTRFTDGGQFGMGAEIGISTQKFHARGPMALKEITSYKWTIIGNGQVRP
jgi:glutamate-5-semialdehyde dehydrogenase